MAQFKRHRPLRITMDKVPSWSQFYRFNVDGCIEEERKRQIKKFGYQYIPFSVWVQVLLEEFGEVIVDYLIGRDMITEGIEVAAVAVAMVENMAIAETNPDLEHTAHFADKVKSFDMLARCVVAIAELGRTLMESDCDENVVIERLGSLLSDITSAHETIYP